MGASGWRVPTALLLIAFSMTSCSGASKPTAEPVSVSAPSGDPYKPPSPLPAGKPGELIWAEKVDLPIRPPSTIWRMLYHSRSRAGADVAVSGFAFVPKAKSVLGRRPVQAWAHGTVGLGDQCAPSRNLKDNFPPYGYDTLVKGGVVVATDYEGLGTPGDQPYAVGESEGRSVLDSVRAVAGLPNVGKIGDVILAGHSQGGAAVLFAAQLAAEYAPELTIRGAVALAPGGELATEVEGLQHSPAIGVALIGAIGMHAAYPELNLSTLLTPKAAADVSQVKSECLDATVSRWRGRPAAALFTRDPVTIPVVKRIFDENSPGAVNPKIPLLIVQGVNDEQVAVAISATIAAKYCRLGVTVMRRAYPGVNHDGVLEAASKDVLAWMADRLEGRAAQSTCNPRSAAR